MQTSCFRLLTIVVGMLLLALPSRAQFTFSHVGGGATGSLTDNGNGSYTLEGGGNDIWSGSDAFDFAHYTQTGDFDVRVRVDYIEPTCRWTKAGLMARETLADNSRMVFNRVTPGDVPTGNGGNGANDSRLGYRTGTSAATLGEHEDGTGAPEYPNAWLRIQRQGTTFIGYASNDGLNWRVQNTLDTTTWEGGALPPAVELGLAVSRHSSATIPEDLLAIAQFRAYANVMVDPVTITRQPGNASVLFGQYATFDVEVAGGFDGFTFQWKRNGADIPGATGKSYTFGPVSGSDDGAEFSVAVVNPRNGTAATSASAALSIKLIYDFDDNTLPGGLTLAGGIADGTPTTFPKIEGGVVKLTGPENSAWGVLTLPDINAGQAVEQFFASFDFNLWGSVCCNNGASPADGMSLNLMVNPPAPAYNVPAEEGFSPAAAFTVAFDTWDNGGGEAPAIDLIIRGQKVATYPIQVSGSPTGATADSFKHVEMSMTADGKFNMTLDGAPIFSDVASGYLPVKGGKWVFGARTGGANDNHWLDNIRISTFQNLGPLVVGCNPDITVNERDPITLAICVDGTPPYEVQWYRNGSPILGETTSYDFNSSDGSFVGVSGGAFVNAIWRYDSASGTWIVDGDRDDCGTGSFATLTSPTLTINKEGEATVTFRHRYSFESDATVHWDGGQVRISVNGGDPVPVPAGSFSQNGYAVDRLIGGNNILAGQYAFAATSPGYGAGEFIESVATLGSFPVGATIAVQFAGGWDECSRASVPNWQITDVQISQGGKADGLAYRIASALPSRDNGSQFYATVKNPLGEATSRTATLTVISDTTPPTLVSASASSFTTLLLTFSEALLPESADPFAFSIVYAGEPPSASRLTVESATLVSPNVILLTTSQMEENTAYEVVVNGVVDLAEAANPIATDTRGAFRSWVAGGGGVLFEAYSGIGGVAVADLLNSPNYPNSPDVVATIAGFSSRLVYADDSHENYGARMRGLFIPPLSGNWVFFLRSDDASRLFLNPNGPDAAGKVQIQDEPGCCNAFAVHPSSPFPLLAGHGYYLELLYKEGGGGDYGLVAATLQGAAVPTQDSQTIPGEWTGAVGAPAGVAGEVVINSPPQNTSVEQNKKVTFTVAASNAAGLPMYYQWRKNGVDIAGATGASYSYLAPLSDDQATISVQVSMVGSKVVVGATLTVISDTTKPTIASAASANGVQIGVRCNETVKAESADAFSWLVNGGASAVSSVTLWPATATESTDLVITLGEGSLPVTGEFTVECQNLVDLAGNVNNSATGLGKRWLEGVDPLGAPNPLGTHFTALEGEIQITTGGADMWDNIDSGTFAWKRVYGNFDINTRVDRLDYIGSLWSKAGINVRKSLDASSQVLAWIYPNPTTGANQNEYARRFCDGCGITDVGQPRPNINKFPYWVRVRRVGNIVNGFWSRDGSTWNVLGPPDQDVSANGYPSDLLMGVGLTPNIGNSGTTTTADYFFSTTILFPNAVITVTGPADATVNNNNTAVFTVAATVSGAAPENLWYLWEEETAPGVFTPIVGAYSPTLSKQVTLADSGKHFRAVVSAEGSNPVTSRAALLTVVLDVDPPYPVAAQDSGAFDRVHVRFNEPLSALGDAFSYEINGPGGATIGLTSVIAGVDDREALLILASQLQPDTDYTVVVQGGVIDLSNNSLVGPKPVNFHSFVLSPGFARREFFLNIGSGVAISDLLNAATYPDRPDLVDYNRVLEGPVNAGDNYGIRVSGFLRPEVSGAYDFYVSADDNAEFWLSTDANPANKVLLCNEPEWNDSRQWLLTDRRDAAAPQNRSLTRFPDGIGLTAGSLYYYEALMKEGGGGDNVGVAVGVHGGTPPANGSTPVPGGFDLVVGANRDGASVNITQQPASIVVGIGCGLEGPSGGAVPTFIADFNGGVPSRTAVYGNAYVGGGALHITDAANSLQGSFVIEDFNDGAPVDQFKATFKVRVADSTCCGGPRPADGWSFNFASDIASASFGEEGSGNGLKIVFDTWDNGSATDLDAPAIEVFYQGVSKGIVSMAGVREGGRAPLTAIPTDPATGQPMTMTTSGAGYDNVQIKLDPDGTVDVTYKGVKVLENVATGYVPTVGRFAFGARTGGANESHWIDDLTIQIGEPPPNSVSFTVAATGAITGNNNHPTFVQWQKNGVNILGANSPILTTQVSPADSGSTYRALVSVPGASVASSVATLLFSLAPEVAIVSPPNGSSLSTCGAATIVVNATDADGTVAKVGFYVEGIGLLGEDVNGADGWSLTIPNPPVGTYIITAKATDNLGISCTSDPIMVTVTDQTPVCAGASAVTAEDTAVSIALVATDDDPVLAYVVVDPPMHGGVTVSGNVATYTPTLNYCGSDSFSFKAVDPCGHESGVCVVNIDVTGVPDAPVCAAASGAVCEGRPVEIILSATDADIGSCLAEMLSFAVVTPPAHGTVTVVGNVATYQGNLGYNGPDSFTFQVTDMYGLKSGVCAVSIVMASGNQSPVGVIKVMPTVDLGPTVPGVNVMSPNNVGACVTLDATQSSDVDNPFSDLSFTWLVDGVVVGTGPVLPDVCLLVGENEVKLIVNDGTTGTGPCDEPAVSETVQMVTVLTGSDAIEELIMQVYDSSIVRKNKQPFIATLKNAAAAFERGSFGAGINMLEALIHKFQAQLKQNPDIQAQWIKEVQSIIDGLNEPVTCDGCTE